MQTHRSKLVRTVFPAILFATLLLGCVDNNSTLFIRQVQAPDKQSDCNVTNDPGALHYGQGVMDRSLTNAYRATLLVGNQLDSRSDVSTQKVESAMVQLYEAEVEVYDFSGATLSAYTMPVSGFIDESVAGAEAYGLSHVVMIDPGVGSGISGGGLGQTVVSRVKLYGENLGGIEVETGWWDYPIFVCDGCLGCECPDSVEAEYAKSCNVGNNESIDCRLHPCWPNCGCILQ